MLNRIILFGKVVSDIEYVEGNTGVTFQLENIRIYGMPFHKEKDVIIIPIRVYKYNSKLCREKLRKNSFVIVEGALKRDETKNEFYVLGLDVVFLDRFIKEFNTVNVTSNTTTEKA